MIQSFFEMPGSYPMAFVFRPAEQAICVEEESSAGLKINRCFSECRSFDQAQWRRHRSEGFCCAVVMNNQDRRVPCADDLSPSVAGLKRNTQRGHDSAS